jgi:hypothetical protein
MKLLQIFMVWVTLLFFPFMASSHPDNDENKTLNVKVLHQDEPTHSVTVFLEELRMLDIIESWHYENEALKLTTSHKFRLFLVSRLSAMMLPAGDDECCCPESTFGVETRNTFVCNDGTNNDSGWQQGDDLVICGEIEDPPKDEADCNTTTDPGEHYGENDLICKTCNYVRYTGPETDSSQCCKVETEPYTESRPIPAEFEAIGNAVAGAAEAAPMIDDMEFSFSGDVSLTIGEECCLLDKCTDPVVYEEHSITLSAGIDVTLNVPGWDWEVDHHWHGIYSIHAEISVGPEITLSPSATASASGKNYLGDCPSCITFNISGSIGLDVKFQGTIECAITLEIWPHGDWSVGGHAELGAKSSVSVKGYRKCCTCSGSGGSVGYGKLEGYGSITLTFMGYDITFGHNITLLPGYTHSFQL